MVRLTDRPNMTRCLPWTQNNNTIQYEVLVNGCGGLSLPRKSVVRLTDHLDMTLDVYHGRKTTTIPNQTEQWSNIILASKAWHVRLQLVHERLQLSDVNRILTSIP